MRACARAGATSFCGPTTTCWSTNPPLTAFATAVFPKGATRPTASNLNYRAGQIVPNNVVVKVGTSGQISLFAFDGCPNLVVDVVGYFAGSG